MCTDRDNNVLFTADTRGRVHGFTLRGLEFRKTGDFTGRGWGSINQTHGWRAHLQQVQSIDLVPAPKGSPSPDGFLITASTDGVAKLWTHSGDLVGSFGADTWAIQEPATWACNAQQRAATAAGQRASVQASGSPEPERGLGSPPARQAPSASFSDADSGEDESESPGSRGRPGAADDSGLDSEDDDDRPSILGTRELEAYLDRHNNPGGARRSRPIRLSTEAQLFLHDIKHAQSAAGWRQAQAAAGGSDEASLKRRLHIHELAPVEVPERLAHGRGPGAGVGGLGGGLGGLRGAGALGERGRQLGALARPPPRIGGAAAAGAGGSGAGAQLPRLGVPVKLVPMDFSAHRSS